MKKSAFGCFFDASKVMFCAKTLPVPMHLRNAPTKLMKEMDYGKNYRYAHDEEDGFSAGENYFPEGMATPSFYRPVARGLEIKIAEKLNTLKLKNAEKS